MTKKELTKQVQTLLNSKSRFDTLSDEETEWLTENVLKFHPEWDWYQEQHPKKVYKDKGEKGTYCFYIEFESGEKSSISFVKCIKNKKI